MINSDLKKNNENINKQRNLLTKDFRLFSYLLQIKQVLELNEEVSSILEIGIGNGFFAHTLKWMGYNIKTFDINPDYSPDYLGDIRYTSIDETFDMVASFECFQHIPYKDFEKTITKISLLAKKYVFISLPYYSPRVLSVDLRIPKTLNNKLNIPEKFRFLKVLNIGNRKNNKYDETTYNNRLH